MSVLPCEERIDDLQDLVLHAPPEILRRDGSHLDEHLPVTHLGGHAPARLVELFAGDLSVAQQKLSQGVLERARSGEDDIALPPVHGALEIVVLHDEASGGADHRQKAENVRQLNGGQVAFEHSLRVRRVSHDGRSGIRRQPERSASRPIARGRMTCRRAAIKGRSPPRRSSSAAAR